jgi:hypothetical protein
MEALFSSRLVSSRLESPLRDQDQDGGGVGGGDVPGLGSWMCTTVLGRLRAGYFFGANIEACA